MAEIIRLRRLPRPPQLKCRFCDFKVAKTRGGGKRQSGMDILMEHVELTHDKELEEIRGGVQKRRIYRLPSDDDLKRVEEFQSAMIKSRFKLKKRKKIDVIAGGKS